MIAALLIVVALMLTAIVATNISNNLATVALARAKAERQTAVREGARLALVAVADDPCNGLTEKDVREAMRELDAELGLLNG